MRTISRTAAALSACLAVSAASAEDVYNLNQNQTGFTLPGVTLPQGQDEVRASDGTTCRSAVGGNGAYLDVGVIQGNGTRSGDLATYGRVVVPIGRKSRRIDCVRLYELEVRRLEMQLKLMEMGLGGTGAQAPAGWADEGWSSGPAAGAAK